MAATQCLPDTLSLPPHLPESAVAELLGIGIRRLRARHLLGDAPARVRLSKGRYVYLPADVEAYIRRCRAVVANDSAPIACQKRGRGRPKGAITRRHSGGEG